MSEKKWLTSDICVSDDNLLVFVCQYNVEQEVYETFFEIVGNAPDDPEGWLEQERRRIAREMLNETDDGWFVGTWNQHSGQWTRGLTKEDGELTGCYSEYSRKPFASLSFENAYSHLMELCADQVDREVAKELLVGVELD